MFFTSAAIIFLLFLTIFLMHDWIEVLASLARVARERAGDFGGTGSSGAVMSACVGELSEPSGFCGGFVFLAAEVGVVGLVFL